MDDSDKTADMEVVPIDEATTFTYMDGDTRIIMSFTFRVTVSATGVVMQEKRLTGSDIANSEAQAILFAKDNKFDTVQQFKDRKDCTYTACMYRDVDMFYANGDVEHRQYIEDTIYFNTADEE